VRLDARITAVLLGCALGTGCERRGDEEPTAEEPEPTVRPAAEIVEVPHGFPDSTRSLKLKRSATLRARPSETSEPVGTVAADVRVRFTRAALGEGCELWVEVAPRGWLCSRHLEPNTREPLAPELPRLRPGELTPGVYGKLRAKVARSYRTVEDVRFRRPARTWAGAVTFKRLSEQRIGHRLFWRTSENELVDAKLLRMQQPSSFEGVNLARPGAPLLPFAWAQSRAVPKAKVLVRAYPDPEAEIVDALEPRSVVQVMGRSTDGLSVRIGLDRWVDLADLHLADLAPLPREVYGEARWLDVNLEEQVLVAYEGRRPVYATLVSTGSQSTPTAPGDFRVWIKFSETDMKGQVGGKRYRVAAVPWVMFFNKDIAFHTAYWHDDFGRARSNGCVNLSPKDARHLYFWARPEVPRGWTMAYATEESPGSWVRVRGGAPEGEAGPAELDEEAPIPCDPDEEACALTASASSTTR
jgi:hypothetical protein